MGTLSTSLRCVDPLPGHARLLALDSVWMEGEALRQLARVAEMDDCRAAVGMPDLHAGPGIPIGVAVAFGSTIHPHLVGGDAGCGARVLSFSRPKFRGDPLEERARELFSTPILGSLIASEVGEAALLEAVWHRGIAALVELGDRVDERLADFAARCLAEEPGMPWLGASAALPGELVDRPSGTSFARSLGTIGGGNHFVELGAVATVVDKEAAAALGLGRRGHAILAHSGSRGLGKAVAERWGLAALADEGARGRYLGELAGALRFAAVNRLLLAWRLAQACGVARSGRITGGLDLVHNYVAREAVGPRGEPAWVHRKGCAPAGLGEATVILGSRGAPSWIMRGLGSRDCLCSVAHGAGRRMTRSEAREKVAAKHRRASLQRTAHGRVVCNNKELLYEEHPAAYKAIAPVIASLEAAGAARRIAALEPLLTVKL